MKMQLLDFRYGLQDQDPARVTDLTRATGFFTDPEIRVAAELVRERLSKGDASGYHFVMLDQGDQLIGYTCYGPIACTLSSFDIYWIAVKPELQGEGLGCRLMAQTERLVRDSGGTRIYVETSQRQQYDGTRAFYEHLDYRVEAVVPDFYAPEDGKVIYCKVLAEKEATSLFKVKI